MRMITDDEDEELIDTERQQMEYHYRPFKVECSYCGKKETDTEENLKARGWLLAKGVEICSSHY